MFDDAACGWSATLTIATGMWVGCVPGLQGAHTQGETLEELYLNLCEVVGLVTEDGSAPGLLPEIQP